MVTNSLIRVGLMGAFPVGLVGTLLVAAIQEDDQESNAGHDNVGTNETGRGGLARLRTCGWDRVDGRSCHSNGQWQNSIASTGRWSM